MVIHPLRAWRTAQTPKVQLEDLAAKVGVKPSHLSMIERGLRGCSLDLAMKLHEATGKAVALDAFAKPARTDEAA